METIKQTPSGKLRARAFDIPFDGQTGRNNSITDVPGVSVGYTTLDYGDGAMVVGNGPVRTGVTAIYPRPRNDLFIPCFSGYFSANGNGDMSGTHMIEEAGELILPITITNTHSAGLVRDATIKWVSRQFPKKLEEAWALPVTAETYDGLLNDINGHHITDKDVFAAIETASVGPIEEGSVGGGTGMVCFEFKGGSGTASRIVEFGGDSYTVGVFVQSNYGKRCNLMVRGHRLGKELKEPQMIENKPEKEKGSIIVVVAVDAPLLPHQLKRLSRRVPLGIAWTGGLGYHSSGDIFVSFSTAKTEQHGNFRQSLFVPDSELDPFFDAVVQATEEAILNSMVANELMVGRDGNTVPGLPHDVLEDVFGLAR